MLNPPVQDGRRSHSRTWSAVKRFFLYDLQANTLRRLTHDAFAEMDRHSA